MTNLPGCRRHKEGESHQADSKETCFRLRARRRFLAMGKTEFFMSASAAPIVNPFAGCFRNLDSRLMVRALVVLFDGKLPDGGEVTIGTRPLNLRFSEPE